MMVLVRFGVKAVFGRPLYTKTLDIPPSVWRICPVKFSGASVNNHLITFATSSFRPTLLTGIFCEAACEAVSFDIIGEASFVSVYPGATALILNPRFA